MGFPSKNTGVGCYFLLQGIFLTQFLNLGLLYRWSPALHLDFLPTGPPAKPENELNPSFYFLTHTMCVCVCVCVRARTRVPSVTSVMSDSLWPHGLSMGFCRQNTGAGCHALLQGIFSTQGLNPCLSWLLRWQEGSLPPEQLGKPREWWYFYLNYFTALPQASLTHEKLSQPLSVPFLPKGTLCTFLVHWSASWEHGPRKHRCREKESSMCPFSNHTSLESLVRTTFVWCILIGIPWKEQQH